MLSYITDQRRKRAHNKDCQRLVMIPLTDEEKKHIWILILLNLFENCIMLLFLFIYLNFLKLYCLLELLYYLENLFQALLIAHTGKVALRFHMGNDFFVCA
jgi:hypothetical protein